MTIHKYRVWLQETELLPLEIEARSEVDARRKVEKMLAEGTLLEDSSIEMSEGSLEIDSVERVE